MDFRKKHGFRNQMLITALRTVGLAVMGILGMYYFSRDIDKSITAIIQKRALIYAQSRQIENLNRLKSDYNSTKSYVSQLKGALPSQTELFDIRSRFDEAAKTVGLTRLNFIWGQEVEAAGTEPKGTLFAFDSVATSAQYLDYLAQIKVLPYFLNLLNFEIARTETPSGAAAGSQTHRFIIKSKVYTR